MSKLSVAFSLSYETSDAAAANPHASSLRVRLISDWCAVTQLSDILGEGGSATVWETQDLNANAADAATAPSDETKDQQQAALPELLPRLLRTYTLRCEIDLPDLTNRERLEQLHSNPSIYAVVLRQETRSMPLAPDAPEGTPPDTEQRLVPVSFVIVDCSRFLVEGGSVNALGQRVTPAAPPAGLAAAAVAATELPLPSLTITSPVAFLSKDTLTPLEPLVLSVSSLGGYPIVGTGASGSAMASTTQLLASTTGGAGGADGSVEEVGRVYVYGRLELGGVTRVVYARPSLVPEPWVGSDDRDIGPHADTVGQTTAGNIMFNTQSTDGGFKGADHYKLDCRVCCLPGLGDLSRFKESLATSTFVLQLHSEDITARAFHSRACDEYHASILAVVASGAGAAAAAPAAKAPAKPPAKGAAAVPAAGASNTTALLQPPAFTEADAFLVQQISRALQVASEIQNHGTGRVRLEQLLKQSVDLLAEFKRRRVGLMVRSAAEGQEQPSLPEAEDVVVREDILAEVRMSKPSRPLKWHLPTDISLSKALEQDLLEQLSRMDGTMAAAGASGTAAAGTTMTITTTKKASKATPWYEQLNTFQTRLVVSAELHRRLQHPTEPPRVFLKVVESFIKDGLTTKTTVASPEHLEALQRRLAITPFSRMVFCFKYDDDPTLIAINEAITRVNSRALPNIQGSIRSYSFTQEETAAAADGSLDVVTGFMVMDDDQRVIVLEGLAAPGKGMQAVFCDIPRTKANDNNLKILASPECLFPARLYGTFGPDLKRIRIRDRLKKLARRPELYNRRQVEELCFSAVDAVMALRRAPDLRTTKELDLYPSAEALNKVELLYGEAISRSDLDGTASEAQRAAQKKEARRIKAQAAAEDALYSEQMYGPSLAAGQSVVSKASKKNTSLATTRRAQTNAGGHDEPVFDRNNPRCPPTDSRNEAFEQYLQTRPEHRIDYLAEQRELSRQVYENTLHRTAARDALSQEILVKILGPEAVAAAGPRGPKIYCYSSQSENFKVKAFSELRQRIAGFTDATYTFSKDFVSQTICVVDEDADRQKIQAEKRSHWLTQTGFTYPRPKTLRDLIEHPKKPSESRIEDLQEPWGDAGPSGKVGAEHAEQLRLERGYSTRIRGGDLFGALKPPSFEHDFALKLVGDRAKLPRGLLVAGTSDDKDPAAFRSVHLGGEGQARIIEEALEKEKADWAAKVVVADTAFKVGGFTTKDKVFQFERTRDILKDPPARKELIKLRDRKSVTGKLDYSYSVAPLSLLSSGPYAANAAANAMNRIADPAKFTTAEAVRDKQTGMLMGKPKDFVRFIDRNANAPRIMCVLSKRSIEPLHDGEIVGAKWEGAGQMLAKKEGVEVSVSVSGGGFGFGPPQVPQ